MNWLFDQLIYGTEECDYAVAAIQNRIPEGRLGRFDDSENCQTEEVDKTAIYSTKVVLHRLGEVKLPVEVLIHFEDGSSKLEKWDGQARSHEFAYQSPIKIQSAQLDPMNKLPIDKNSINNSRTIAPTTIGIWKYVSNVLLWVQQSMEAISILV